MIFMAKMVLVCGMSGSGKTTFAKEFAKKNGYTYVCPDDYYARINGDECKHYNFFEIWMSLWRDLHNYEINNVDVVVDTNALTRGQREQFLEWFPTFEHYMIWNEASFELCCANNEKRRRVIPMERMKSMWAEMESPDWNDARRWKAIRVRENYNNKIIYTHGLTGTRVEGGNV